MDKICRVCGELLEIDSNFHKKKGTKDGYRNECKICVKDLLKKYKDGEENKKKRKEYDEKRYSEKKEEILEHKKEYYQKNADKIKEQKKEYRQTDNYKENNKKWWSELSDEKKKEYYEKSKPTRRICSQRYRDNNTHIVVWRNVLYATLKRLGTKKVGHTVDMLGYSALELKEYIEKLFVNDMSWDNHGTLWHIDHIIPVSKFDKDTPANVVCALSNLQPLYATTREIDGVLHEGNLNKSGKLF